MIVGDMEIRLRADIARLQRDMDDARRVVGNAVSGMERAASAAKTALASIGAGIGLQQIAALADQYAKVTAQLKLATESQREYAQAYADVKRIAASAQADLGATGVLYARIVNGTRELGVSQQKVAAITETVNMALKVSGATAQESASAQLQLSQAFAAGALRGEEFNAVNEAAPRLMKALADGMGVPVGALKQMATEGKITSQIMADVLPQSLAKLQEEAKQVQTIAGAFTNLKSNVMEFVGVQAQASGIVSGLTGGINLLANNLQLVAGAVLTLTAAKFASWLTETAQRGMAAVAANRALAASNLATAEANATATASASLLANARLAEVRAATLAASAETQLALTTNGLIPAQARATAAAAAHTEAMLTLGVAQRAASTAMTAGSMAVTALGGPVGALITVLGVAATAWSWYKSKQEEANLKAASDTEASTNEIIENLDKQNAKLRERLELSKKVGMADAARVGGPEVERMASLLKQINDLKAQGNQLDGAGQVQLVNLQGIYDDLAKKVGQNKEVKRELDASGSAAADLVAVRERLAGVNKQYFEDLQKLQTAREKGAIGEKEYIALVSQLATETYKASEAGKAAASSATKEKTAYESLLSAVREKVAAGALEMNGYDKLAESQKLTIKLNDDIAAGKIKVTSQHLKTLQALIAERKAQEDVIASQKRAAEGAEEWAKISKTLNDTRSKSIEDAAREAEKNEELARTFGMTKSAIEAQTLASLDDQLAKRGENALTLDQIENLKQLIELKKRSVAALGSLEAQEANKKAADDMAAEFKRASEQIGQSLTDNIMRGGKSAAEYLRDLFRTLVLRPILAPIGTAIGGATASMFMPGMAQASTGAGKDPISMAQAASSVYNMMKSGGTFEQSITNAVQSGFDKMGLSMSGGAPSQAAQWAGTAGGTIGGYMIGSSLNSAISGKYETGSGFMTAEKIGTAVASAVFGPIGGAIAGAVSGLINRAFGMGSKEVTAAGMRGTLSGSGLTGTNYANWHQDGGWFRSDRNGTDLSAFDPEVTKRFTQGFEAIKAMSAGFADAIGQSADSLKDYAKTFDIVLGKDQSANEKAVSDFFDNLGDEIANSLVPNLYSLQKAGESASAALQRLAGDFQATDQMAQLIGKSAKEVFGSVGIESAAVRERLIDMSGGVAALTQQAQFFNQNFLTDAERLKPVSEAVGAAMASLGLSAVTTREQFKQVAMSLDLTTEQGAKQFASMMKLSEAFAQVHPLIEATTDALKDQAQAMRDQATGLLGGVDQAFSVLQSVVAREKSALQARIDVETAAVNKLKSLSDTLHGALDSMSMPGSESSSRAAAQAQIKTALALAKAGGVLPDADSMKRALGVVGKDASSLFSTYADYQRDFYSTQNDIADLAKLSDDALSVEEKSLKALQDEVKSLDLMLEREREQIDQLKGLNTTGLSILQAVQALHGAVLAAQANPVVSATAAVNKAYQSALGRAPDAAGLEFWQQQAANGVSQSAILDAIQNSPEAKVQQMYQSLLGRTADAEGLRFWLSSGASSSGIQEAIMQSAEYKRLRGFDVGINRVPVDMPAMIHKDEAVIPAALNPFNPNARANGLSGGTERLERLVENLTATVERQQQALNKIANTSKRSTDILEVVTEGGNAMRTTV